MGKLFHREATLILGGTAQVSTKIDAVNQASVLRFAFHTEQSLASNPNKAEVVVYNLAPSTRSKLQSKGIEVAIEAGYIDSVQLLFKGKTRTTEHRHEGADWVTKLTLGDGEIEFRQKRVSKSWGPNTSFADIVKDAAEALGLSKGNLDKAVAKLKKDGMDKFSGGFVADGRAADVIKKLCDSAGLSFSIQNEALTVLDQTETTDEPTIVLSSGTGLIGAPEAAEKEEKKGTTAAFYKIKSLLNAGIRPGRQVEIRSETIKGKIRVEKVEHTGDTAGQDWYTTFEGKPIVT